MKVAPVPALFCLGLLAACGTPEQSRSLVSWLAEIESVADSGSRIQERIDAEGGTPLREGDRVLFLAQARAGRAPQVVGDFNDGGSVSSPFVGEGRMRALGESGWFSLWADCPRDANLQYRIRHGDRTSPDPNAPVRVETFGSERSLLRGPTVRRAHADPGAALDGELQRFTFRSQVRGNEREVVVYIPPGRDRAAPALPTLYLQDGTLLLEEGGADAIADRLIRSGDIPPVVLVFVDPVQRGLEYGTADSYRRMIVEELVPEIERRHHTGGSAGRRAILGVSRGGLAALDLALEEPDVFGHAILFAPALKPLPILESLAARASVPGSYQLFVSSFDTPSLVAQGRRLSALLRERAKAECQEIPSDHSIEGWRPWLDFALRRWPRADR